MFVCHDQRNGTGCGAVNQDNAQFCKQCGRALRFALQLHNAGEVIGAYRIVRVIGHGGFGAVYEAQEMATGQTVALKETFDPDQIQSYQAEFAVLARLQHPHLPRYDNVFTAGGNGYLVMELVMELVPGQSLEEVLKKQGGPLLEAQVLGYALQLCDALAYLNTDLRNERIDLAQGVGLSRRGRSRQPFMPPGRRLPDPAARQVHLRRRPDRNPTVVPTRSAATCGNTAPAAAQCRR